MSSCSLFRHATLLHGEKKRCVTRRLSVRFAAFTKSAVIEQIVHEERTVQAQGVQRRRFQCVFTRNYFLGAQEITQRFCKMKKMEGALQTIRNEPVIRRSLKTIGFFISRARPSRLCRSLRPCEARALPSLSLSFQPRSTPHRAAAQTVERATSMYSCQERFYRPGLSCSKHG